MGDNLNANGAAPVAPYVFLSFLFEIVVEFRFLVCVIEEEVAEVGEEVIVGEVVAASSRESALPKFQQRRPNGA